MTSMNKQNGFVSIIVATVLMILISLITIGFSKLMQREQRQALDRQLSTQAYYAAESGVNDVKARIQAGTLTTPEKTTCDVSGWDSVVDPTRPEVEYTCLQYDQDPLDLVFTDTIITNSSKVFPIEADVNIASTTFEWTNLAGANTTSFGTCAVNTLPVSFPGNNVPMLRIDLIDAPFGSPTRDNLINRTSTLYLYPKTCGTNSINFANYIGDNSGRVVDVNCNPRCSLTVTGLNATRYYARVKSVYGDVGTFRVTAFDGASNQLELKNAQTMVDSTGKANDVLRRIEVRLSNQPDYDWPEAVIETSAGLCKQLRVAPVDFVTNSACYN